MLARLPRLTLSALVSTTRRSLPCRQQHLLETEIKIGRPVSDIHQGDDPGQSLFRREVVPELPAPLLLERPSHLGVAVSRQIDQEERPVDQEEVQHSRLARRLGHPGQVLTQAAS